MAPVRRPAGVDQSRPDPTTDSVDGAREQQPGRSLGILVGFQVYEYEYIVFTNTTFALGR